MQIEPNQTHNTLEIPQVKKQKTPQNLSDPHPLEMYPDLLDNAAEEIHNAWMERNPKNDYNKHLHTPYRNLPEKEKQKDREHLLTASALLDEIPMPSNIKKYDEMLANAFGALQHEKWRNGFDPDKSGKEGIKPSSNGPANINIPRETLEAGRAAIASLKKLNIAIGESIIQTLGKKYLVCK